MKMQTIEVVTDLGLRKLINKAADGNPTSWSKDREITPQQTSAFLRGTQGAGLKLPGAFGLVPITVYVPEGSELIPPPMGARAATPAAKEAESKSLRKALKKSVKAEKKTKKKKKGKK